MIPIHRSAHDRRHGRLTTATRNLCTATVWLRQRGYAAVSEKPNSKTPSNPANDLYERARSVKESLARLLKEINELLEKTKHADSGENLGAAPQGDA
jgi:hypothetical protein